MDFRSLSAQEGLDSLRSLHEGLYDWIKNLVERNKELEDEAADLQNARDAARNFRRENDKLKRKLESSGPGNEASGMRMGTPQANDEKGNYVLVLVDGDALPFTDELISKGYEGGKQAAEKLLSAAFVIARKLIPSVRFTTKITVYSNVAETASALVESNKIVEADELRAFTHGFTRAKPLGNMIDVGTEVDASDKKVKDELKQWHLKNPQCRLILLGASHDNGFAHTFNFLETCDTSLLKKIVLLEGANKIEEYTNRIFLREKISSVFNNKKLGTSFRNSPVAAVRPNRTKSGSTSSWIGGKPKESVPKVDGTESDLVGWGPPANHEPESETWIQSPTSVDGTTPPWRSRTAAKSKALGSGNARTKVFFPGRPSEEAFNKIKSLSPRACNQFYLQGRCFFSERDECTYSHEYMLSAEEIEAMKLLVMAKSNPCKFGDKCTRRETCFRKHVPDGLAENGQNGQNGAGEDIWNNEAQGDVSDEDKDDGGATYNW